MSTTFGIKIRCFGTQEVAFRSNGGTITIKNPLVLLLPDDTELEALDNSSQGIETVRDLKKELDWIP